MIIDTVVVGMLMENCYIVGCERSREAVVIDPGDDSQRILDTLDRHGLTVRYVLNTHGHFDHVGGNGRIVQATGAKLLIHELDSAMLARADVTAAKFGLLAENSPTPAGFLHDGQFITFGDHRIQVVHTPGHTPGGCSLLVENVIFTGDTLFADSVGRTDFPGGSAAALTKSIKERLLTLPDQTVVYPGHGPSTTIGREKRHNPYIVNFGTL